MLSVNQKEDIGVNLWGDVIPCCNSPLLLRRGSSRDSTQVRMKLQSHVLWKNWDQTNKQTEVEEQKRTELQQENVAQASMA